MRQQPWHRGLKREYEYEYEYEHDYTPGEG
jgi:hypothetical protein